jgi:hypothetical protein
VLVWYNLGFDALVAVAFLCGPVNRDDLRMVLNTIGRAGDGFDLFRVGISRALSKPITIRNLLESMSSSTRGPQALYAFFGIY